MSEPPRSPAPPGGGCVGLLAQFSSAVQKQRWPQAIALSEQILKMEPDNEMVLQFQPLLEQADAKRLKKGEFHDGSSSSSDEEDGDDGDNVDDSDGDGAGAAATGGGGGAGGAVTMGTVVSEENSSTRRTNRTRAGTPPRSRTRPRGWWSRNYPWRRKTTTRPSRAT